MHSADLHSVEFGLVRFFQNSHKLKVALHSAENPKKFAQCGSFFGSCNVKISPCIVRNLHSADFFWFWILLRTVQGLTVSSTYQLPIYYLSTTYQLPIMIRNQTEQNISLRHRVCIEKPGWCYRKRWFKVTSYINLQFHRAILLLCTTTSDVVVSYILFTEEPYYYVLFSWRRYCYRYV